MIEAHVNPEKALSDADQQLVPEELGHILKKLRYKSSSTEKIKTELSVLREHIDEIDCRLISTLGRRSEISKQIGELKIKEGIAPFQPDRWNKMIKERIQYAKKYNLADDFTRILFENIHEESIRCQSN
jgi:chorismate mutase